MFAEPDIEPVEMSVELRQSAVRFDRLNDRRVAIRIFSTVGASLWPVCNELNDHPELLLALEKKCTEYFRTKNK